MMLNIRKGWNGNVPALFRKSPTSMQLLTATMRENAVETARALPLETSKFHYMKNMKAEHRIMRFGLTFCFKIWHA
jgi:hypothetical protein